MDTILTNIKYYKSMFPVYSAMLLFSFHYFLILYINSSALEQYWTASAVGTLYTIGSLTTILILLIFQKIASRTSNLYLFIGFAILEVIGSVLMFISGGPILSALGFLFIQASSSILFFSLDLFLENTTIDETKTGRVRSIFLTLSNTTVVISPLLGASLVDSFSYNIVYIISIIFLIPLFYIGFSHFKKIKEKESIEKPSVFKTLSYFTKEKDLRRVFESGFILRVFYAFMTIYLPIYLHIEKGFSWGELGIVFTIMLLPFLLFEIPLGNIADKWLGEKEIMFSGFIITALSMFLIFYLDSSNIIIITALLFLSRIGAAAIEITTESYFFKKVDGSHTDLISFYRMATPLSFILTPILVWPIIGKVEYVYVFLVLAIILLVGIVPTLLLKDTK